MRVVDFTHVLRREMPVYPGTPLPELAVASTWERDGFHETRLTLHSHTGTHMDAPAHLFPAGATLDALPPARFAGTALVVPCAGAGAVLHMDLLAPVKDAADRADFLLFHTGWDRLWGQAAYFEGYPVPGHRQCGPCGGRGPSHPPAAVGRRAGHRGEPHQPGRRGRGAVHLLRLAFAL